MGPEDVSRCTLCRFAISPLAAILAFWRLAHGSEIAAGAGRSAIADRADLEFEPSIGPCA
jgi:hypothetical protein